MKVKRDGQRILFVGKIKELTEWLKKQIENE